MPAGRPCEYSEEILVKSNDYLQNHKSYQDTVPSISGLSIHLDVARSTMYHWAEINKEFQYTLEKILEKQERLLLSGGLDGNMNATIVKLMLANRGYSDRVDQTSNGKEIGVLPTVINIHEYKPDAKE